MIVKELIEKLKEFPEDMEVHYEYDSGYSTIPVEQLEITGQGHRCRNEPKVVLLSVK